MNKINIALLGKAALAISAGFFLSGCFATGSNAGMGYYPSNNGVTGVLVSEGARQLGQRGGQAGQVAGALLQALTSTRGGYGNYYPASSSSGYYGGGYRGGCCGNCQAHGGYYPNQRVSYPPQRANRIYSGGYTPSVPRFF